MTSATKVFNQTKEKFAMPIKDFWQQRQPRERVMLSCGLAVVLSALVYLLLIDPALSGRMRLQKSLPVLRQQAAELQLLTARAATLSGRTAQLVAPLSKGAIDTALTGKGLMAKSVVMSGDFAKVQLSDVAFAGLLDWLDEVQKTAHWQVADATVTLSAQAGVVNASVTLSQQTHE